MVKMISLRLADIRIDSFSSSTYFLQQYNLNKHFNSEDKVASLAHTHTFWWHTENQVSEERSNVSSNLYKKRHLYFPQYFIWFA